MNTKIKNTKSRKTKLRKTKSRKTNHIKNKTYKMKGGAFILNWFRSITTPENKELNEDLKTFLTHKETIRKTMQSMYDNAKNAEDFNKNYALFTESVTNINKLVKDINNHRSKPANAITTTKNTNPANAAIAKDASANTGAVGAIGAGAGLIGAGAGAIVGIKNAKNALMGSP
jgi:hypothetical protein